MLAISFWSCESNREQQKRVLFTISCFIFHVIDIVMVLFGIKLLLNSWLKQNWRDSWSWRVGGSDVTPEFLSFALAVELSLVGRATPDRAHCAAPMGRTYLFSAVPPGCSALGTRDPALGHTGVTRWPLTVSVQGILWFWHCPCREGHWLCWAFI